jgi:hypothetical protein
MNTLTRPIFNYVIPNTAAMFFLGGGLCYVIEKKKYTHLPVVILFPSIYCGYNIYKNRSQITDFITRKTN